MSDKQDQTTTDNASGSGVPGPGDKPVSGRYYTEGTIKELRIKSGRKAAIFTIEPSAGFEMEFADNRRRNCAIFRPARQVSAGNTIRLFSGDFTFKAPKGETLDQLLLLKINRCNIRLYVENVFKYSGNTKNPIHVVEMRVK